jgi:hypothetical protein
VVTVSTLDDDDPVTVTPAVMPAMIAVNAVFGASAVRAVMIPMMTVLDHDRLGIRHRRCDDRKRANGRNDISKLPHDVLLEPECT